MRDAFYDTSDAFYDTKLSFITNVNYLVVIFIMTVIKVGLYFQNMFLIFSNAHMTVLYYELKSCPQ